MIEEVRNLLRMYLSLSSNLGHQGLEEFSRRKKLAQSPPRAQAKEHVIKTCPSAPRIKLIDLPEEC